MGLDKPFFVQYGLYLTNAIQGNFGTSYIYGQQAFSVVLERLPATLKLALSSVAFATIVSIPLGVISATRRNTLIDNAITTISVIGKAMPNFWIGIMLILLFSVTLNILPVSGSETLSHFVLPTVTLGIGIAMEMIRFIRSSMIETLNQDYIRTAESKGLRNSVVVYRHAFRNSLVPVITILALQTSTLIGGALIVETIFSWPGLGQLLIQAVNYRDMAVVQACVFVIAILVIVINLLADILYRKLNPQIDYK